MAWASIWHSISTGDSISILALGSGERLLYPSNRVRTANPVSVRVRDMVSASLSSAAVKSPVLIESPVFWLTSQNVPKPKRPLVLVKRSQAMSNVHAVTINTG